MIKWKRDGASMEIINSIYLKFYKLVFNLFVGLEDVLVMPVTWVGIR